MPEQAPPEHQRARPEPAGDRRPHLVTPLVIGVFTVGSILVMVVVVFMLVAWRLGGG